MNETTTSSNTHSALKHDLDTFESYFSAYSENFVSPAT